MEDQNQVRHQVTIIEYLVVILNTNFAVLISNCVVVLSSARGS